jgi:3-methylfumaryl-CoA hydratase
MERETETISEHDVALYRRHIGRTLTETDTVGAPVVARLAATLDREQAGATLPPLWHYGLFLTAAPTRTLGPDGHPPRGGFMPPVTLPRRMFAGSDLTFHRPLQIGQEVTRVSRIASVEHRHGRSGHLVFVRVAMTLSQGGDTCLEEEQTIVYREAGARVPAVAETARTPLAFGETSEDWTPGAVELFRYSCATFNSHRIHYDRPYTVEEEGYPALVVHGPLTATRLADFALRLGKRSLHRFTFRGEAPLFVDQPVRLVGRPDGASCTLRAERADGVTAMSATAVFGDTP